MNLFPLQVMEQLFWCFAHALLKGLGEVPGLRWTLLALLLLTLCRFLYKYLTREGCHGRNKAKRNCSAGS